ncbi:hypothetical protein CLAFUW4_05131 [Fulvia fulva]|uniref:F-box domain-containing protein n=1 Tax=Passalora fulva TaxID=5499 RepID=A0A9Q8UUF5_PASFU|nr:uncharacterized protein CLAFUR5_11775 [Fulvia fulva]KAK4626966.1 hypothetical protein CLAFUR4_05117 [Fulvia fulva]KAK4628121.1 hypothetical protein CLAFUR0_05122 [Fulvia fulva]UJO22899.1 hypothetical protein CLAFUR5_11775 [Fulvia fulva]WPV13610.1 hypothetical protein CLAFUW4_05131 [Fulvia fulva]WPV28116.1 hypothetical protein CLAFUW7_05126 [Fulvia fulva]
MSTPSPQPCPLLDKLPPELRNNIYTHLFAFDQTQTYHLAKCSPTPKAITQTCHQLHCEASFLYRTSFRHFWSSARFELNRPDELQKEDWSITHLRDEDLAHITNLTLERGQGPTNPDRLTYKLIDARGGWSKRHSAHNREDSFGILAGSFLGQIKLECTTWYTRKM